MERIDKSKSRKGAVLQIQDVRLACGENFNKRELSAINWLLERANELIEASRGLSDDLSRLHQHLSRGGSAIGMCGDRGLHATLPMNQTHAELPKDLFMEHWKNMGLRWLPYEDVPRTPSMTEGLETRVADLEKALRPFANFVFNERSIFLERAKNDGDAIVLCGYDEQNKGKTTGVDVKFSDFDRARSALGMSPQKLKS